MLAEILWLMEQVKANGSIVNGADTQVVCTTDSGMRATAATGGNARLENLGLGLLLKRDSDETSEEKAQCRFVVPVQIPEGYYPKWLEAKYAYDIVKSQRTQARLEIRLNVGGFALWRASRTYPMGQFVEPEASLATRITLSPDNSDTASVIDILCQRPDFPVPLGVEVSLEGSRTSAREELRLGQGEEGTLLELKAGALQPCASSP